MSSVLPERTPRDSDRYTDYEFECSGERHRVRVYRAGPVALLDHDAESVRSETVLAVLGGGACRCVSVLLAWRQMLQQRTGEVRYKLPQILVDAILPALAKATQRRRDRIDRDHAEADARRKTGKRFLR